jgi:diguanylate cyclase (GGDEF)-like protein
MCAGEQTPLVAIRTIGLLLPLQRAQKGEDLSRHRHRSEPMTTHTRSARSPAASRQELDAARREIEALRTQGSRLMRQVALLAQEVARARQFAHHDGLTGLPNRHLLLDRYNQAVAAAARQHRQVALLFLDLDGFKTVNDTYGHAAGDRVLQQVAARLRACIRTSDTACRYGGDEFVILLPQYEGRESAVAVAEKVCAHLAAPYAVGGTAISVTASIGMSTYPIDGHEYGDLMQVTDRAMYRNKVRDAAAPGKRGAGLSTWRRASGIDRNEDHQNEARYTEAHASGEEIRSGTGRSLQ